MYIVKKELVNLFVYGENNEEYIRCETVFDGFQKYCQRQLSVEYVWNDAYGISIGYFVDDPHSHY